jgi:hypothetical protein
MTPPNKTEHRAIVDTHRHPIGPIENAGNAELPRIRRCLRQEPPNHAA